MVGCIWVNVWIVPTVFSAKCRWQFVWDAYYLVHAGNSIGRCEVISIKSRCYMNFSPGIAILRSLRSLYIVYRDAPKMLQLTWLLWHSWKATGRKWCFLPDSPSVAGPVWVFHDRWPGNWDDFHEKFDDAPIEMPNSWGLPSGNDSPLAIENGHWVIVRWFIYPLIAWWFSIVMLIYQRVPSGKLT